MSSENPQSPKKYNYCEICDYKCISTKDFNKHLMTKKHNAQKCSKMLKKNPFFTCECGKNYKHIQSMNRHKKRCFFEQQEKTNNRIENLNQEINYKEMFLKMINENKELRCQISELIPKVGNNNNNNNSTTINNKQKFNINIFLNEQCKDALTMNEFIDKIKITLDNLLVTKNKGLSEGVSNIFIENMNKLSLHERPIHCTDVKRETVYIKSGGLGMGDDFPQWEKDEANIKLKQAISKVSDTQRKNLDLWVQKHPNWKENSVDQDEYMMLIKNCTDDLKENNKEEKVIKKLCNSIYLNNN
uniref:C2H2-type domain-containing protein n=1 Tax=viral metagenome TaxID=1070528 RepID=A0A6C0AZE7_9ZZZZ|tara:strand:+ start:3721 stop:4623 length:903 start_codon:yes stop_codon:yes gene_type:complete